MKTIWHGELRRKRNEYKHWTEDTTAALIEGMSEIFCDPDKVLWKINISLAGKAGPTLKQRVLQDHVRDEAYQNLILSVIDRATDKGAKPLFHFDSQKQSKADHTIHEWAKDAFCKGQSTLLYAYLTRGLHIHEPVFVKPASHPFLELADFFSFAVARHHYCIDSKRTPEINLKCLGRVVYVTIEHPSGNLVEKPSTGFPWHGFELLKSASPNVQPPQRDSSLRVGRNDLCPCNSGKKYKRCHGKIA